MELEKHINFIRDEMTVLARSTQDPARSMALTKLTARFTDLGKALIALEARVQALEKQSPKP